MNCDQTGISEHENKLLIVEIYKIGYITQILLTSLAPYSHLNLRLSILILNSPCAEGARDVKNIRVKVIISPVI